MFSNPNWRSIFTSTVLYSGKFEEEVRTLELLLLLRGYEPITVLFLKTMPEFGWGEV